MCDGKGFALEASDGGFVLLCVGEHDLEGNFALEGFLVGAKDSAHATASDLFFEYKRADLSANHGRDRIFELFLLGHGGKRSRMGREQLLERIKKQGRSEGAFKDVLFAFLTELSEERLLVG